MRKLKLQVQISIDGYIAGVNKEMDWITWNLDDDILKYISDLNHDIDCILLGSELAKGFIPHWKAEATDPGKKRDFVKRMSEPYDFARKMHETNKVVFTKSLENSIWDHTLLAKGDLAEEVNQLKNQSGSDMMVYGGAGFVSSLIKAALIDEFYLFINPVAIGQGMSIFQAIDVKQDFNLLKAKSFECGILVAHYELKKN